MGGWLVCCMVAWLVGRLVAWSSLVEVDFDMIRLVWFYLIRLDLK